MQFAPKYSQLEIERRWLADLDRVGPLDALNCRKIEDHYLTGTQLRLRAMHQIDGSPVYKLCKKYGKISTCVESITNIYLSECEYNAFALLPCDRVTKSRYEIAGGALDVYLNPHAGLAIFEVEFSSEEDAEKYRAPDFTIHEVTANPQYSGSAIATAPE